MPVTEKAPSARKPHLTPSERLILSFMKRHEGRPCSKMQIAASIGRCMKTVDRSVANLRAKGLLVSEPVFDENGAQLANAYRVVR